jgi:dTDP-4-dehydrorhamnose reductase
VTPVHSDYFAAEYFSPRPPSERLLTRKLDLRGLNVMRDWRVCLDEYLAEYYEGYLATESA